VKNPGYFRVMNTAEYGNAEDSPEMELARSETLSLVRDVLRRRKKGEGDGDPDAVNLAAQCLVHGLACMFVDGNMALAGYGPEQAEKVAKIVTEVFGYGLFGKREK
jgi:hypothetical protein